MIIAMVAGIIPAQQAQALSGSSFKAGRIIDDVIFFTSGTMSISSIQSFLNAKVPTCDTNGTQAIYDSSYGDTVSRAVYAQRRGVSTPFTCLKDYRQNTVNKGAETGLCNGYHGANQSAAEIIYYVSDSCGINPKVLIVLLQKEQSLVTDDWPWPIQYRSATGYGCPDTAPCDAEYYGFFNQVYAAARQFKRYSRDAALFSYRTNRTNYILYNPNTACGGSNVYIENQATAGLYNYTPYQPNAAALNNLYGTGDACSAYGNRNFWRLFNDWFGTPINDAYAWELAQDPGTGKIYLITNNTKHWIPGPALMQAWGLDDVSYRSVDSAYLSNFADGPNLTYVGLDLNGTRYIMSQGKKYRLSSDAYVLLWGVAGSSHIFAPGPLTQAASGGDAGRFAQDTSNGYIYLLNGTSKHLGVSAQSLSYWGQSISNTTTVTPDVIGHLPSGVAVDRYVNAGGRNLVVDGGQVNQFSNSNFEHAWGSRTYISLPAYAVNVMSRRTAGNFVFDKSNGRWYYLEAGRKHYISNSIYAEIWGWGAQNPLIGISTELANDFSTAGNLSYLAVEQSTNKLYLADGSKHVITDAQYASIWQGPASVETYSDQSIALMPNGAPIATMIVGFYGHPHIYVVDNSSLRHIPGPAVLDAFGAYRNNPIIALNQNLYAVMPKSSPVDLVIKDNSANAYYLENGYRYSLGNSSLDTWGATSAPALSDSLIHLLTNKATTINNTISAYGHKYLINGRSLLDITYDFENYGLSTNSFVSLARLPFPVKQTSGYLVGTPNNNKVWLLAQGKRYHIKSFGALVDLGYGSHTAITSLNQDIVANLPEEAQEATRLLRAPNTGVIFAASGAAYGFKDLLTLQDYSTGQFIAVIPSSLFNRFSFSGWASRIILGNDGRVYAVEDGKKHWIINPSLLNTKYSQESWWLLPQYSVDAFPTGAPISN